jgi:hypothetical protein
MLLNRNQVSKDYVEEDNYVDRYNLLHGVKAKLASGLGEPMYRTKKKKVKRNGAGGADVKHVGGGYVNK